MSERMIVTGEDEPGRRGANPVIVVFVCPHRLVESADALVDGAPENRHDEDRLFVGEDCRKVRLGSHIGTGTSREAVEATAEISRIASHDADFPPGLQDGDLLFEVCRVPHVVAIEQREIIPARMSERLVARGGDAAVVLPDQSDTPVMRGDIRDNRQRFVGGPIVDDDHFEIRERLRQH